MENNKGLSLMISGADKGIVSTAFYLSGLIQAYLFRLVSSSSILSDTVMILEFAWKPRCVVIISVNSVARSTFDISSCPVLIEPPSEVMSTPIPSKSPEFKVVP